MTDLMIVVRAELPSDVDAIRDVNERAFGRRAEGYYVDLLREGCGSDLISLVAVRDEQVVGHILFSPAKIESVGRTISGLGLAPMAVLPEFQRQGIGSRLVRAGMEEVRRQGTPFVIVLGHPEFYPRFEFIPASQFGIACPYPDVPDEAFMIRVFEPAALTGVTGTARYRPEFEAAV